MYLKVASWTVKLVFLCEVSACDLEVLIKKKSNGKILLSCI